MPRRSLSESGYYHVVVRSAGKVALFEDDADRRCYLRLLKEAREKTGARIIAWVLMTNHVHLVVDFGESSSAISAFMSRLTGPTANTSMLELVAKAPSSREASGASPLPMTHS